MNEFKAMLAAEKVAMADRIFEDAKAGFARAVESLGMAWVVKNLRTAGNHTTLVWENQKVVALAFNEASALAAAKRTAEATVDAAEQKLMAKLAGVEIGSLRICGDFFIAEGTKAGHAVEIRQQRIINHNGFTVFNQFPAVIYIDGRKASEKALKAL